MPSQSEEDATISFPSIAVVAIIGFLIYRYFFASSSSTSSSRNSNGLRFTSAQVDTVAQMFPQLSRRDIMWDLQRNRGSVQATTERLLTGRGLDPAPPSFQPVLPQQTSGTSSGIQASSIFSKPKPAEPDLITRYNLQSRIASSDKGKSREEPEAQTTVESGAAATKEERQKILQRRRDEMILQARRKMMEKDALRSGDADNK